MTTQQKILDQYKEIRGDFLDGEDQIKQGFFNDLVQYRYIKHIGNYKNKKVLEIGCNKGFLLKTLQENGFNNLNGIDLSQSDLDIAQKRTSLDTLKKEDLFIELKENKFDVIISKDVMEHVVKEKQEEFVKSVHQALNEGGGSNYTSPKYGLAHE
jgi:2-polyprenyl-3-methyl-5-hydroxy-6-metoxy-1,4-benzoquinol methylase